MVTQCESSVKRVRNWMSLMGHKIVIQRSIGDVRAEGRTGQPGLLQEMISI